MTQDNIFRVLIKSELGGDNLFELYSGFVIKIIILNPPISLLDIYHNSLTKFYILPSNAYS